MRRVCLEVEDESDDADDFEPAARWPTGYSDPGGPAEFVGSRFSNAAGDVTRRGVYCPHWAGDVTTSKAQLLVLSQFAYWFLPSNKGKLRAKQNHFGRWWVYKTYGSLATETNLSSGQVRAAVRALVEWGILVSFADKNSHKPPFYRIDPEAVERRFHAARTEVLRADAKPLRSEDSR